MRRIKDGLTACHTSDSGLRSVHLSEKTSRVGLMGVICRAGSRYDSPGKQGLAHFVEHTVFKGTDHRSSWHILNRMERVGGELNAYTGKQDMVIYTLFPAGNESRAAELLADLTLHATFPTSQLDKEKNVVLEEIDAFLDSPSEKVYDDFEDILFKGTSLGFNILGSEKSLSSITREDCLDFMNARFIPGNMALFYSGPLSHTRFFDLLDKFFRFPESRSKISTLNEQPLYVSGENFDIVRNEPLTHQANVIGGIATGSPSHREKAALALLSNMLGGPGMNSLLNVKIREKRGLVYTVETAFNILSDISWFTVYFASEPDKRALCVELINSTIDSLANTSVNERMLAAVKKQYIGQLALAWENRENEATELAKYFLNHDRLVTHTQTVETVMSLTPDDLRDAAKKISNLSWLSLIP